jgi:hypothetical protein
MMRTKRWRYLPKGCPFNEINTITNLIDSRASAGSMFQWYYMRYRKLGIKHLHTPVLIKMLVGLTTPMSAKSPAIAALPPPVGWKPIEVATPSGPGGA